MSGLQDLCRGRFKLRQLVMDEEERVMHYRNGAEKYDVVVRDDGIFVCDYKSYDYPNEGNSIVHDGVHYIIESLSYDEEKLEFIVGVTSI